MERAENRRRREVGREYSGVAERELWGKSEEKQEENTVLWRKRKGLEQKEQEGKSVCSASG